MDWLIIMVVMLAYFDMKTKIQKVINNQKENAKKDFSLLKDLLGKNVKIESDDEYILVFGTKQQGILKEFNDTWLIIETENKKGKELIYYRLNNIKGILEVK